MSKCWEFDKSREWYHNDNGLRFQNDFEMKWDELEKQMGNLRNTWFVDIPSRYGGWFYVLVE